MLTRIKLLIIWTVGVGVVFFVFMWLTWMSGSKLGGKHVTYFELSPSTSKIAGTQIRAGRLFVFNTNLKNSSSTAASIKNIQKACGCTHVKHADGSAINVGLVVPAKTSIPIIIEIATEGRVGEFSTGFSFELASGDAVESVAGKVDLFVLPGLDLRPQSISKSIICRKGGELRERVQIVGLPDDSAFIKNMKVETSSPNLVVKKTTPSSDVFVDLRGGRVILADFEVVYSCSRGGAFTESISFAFNNGSQLCLPVTGRFIDKFEISCEKIAIHGDRGTKWCRVILIRRHEGTAAKLSLGIAGVKGLVDSADITGTDGDVVRKITLTGVIGSVSQRGVLQIYHGTDSSSISVVVFPSGG